MTRDGGENEVLNHQPKQRTATDQYLNMAYMQR